MEFRQGSGNPLYYSQFNKLCNNDINLFLKKVIFLVLLTNLRRIPEFQAFSITKSIITANKSILKPHDKFIKKNSSAKFCPKDICIPSFPDNKLLCPKYL